MSEEQETALSDDNEPGGYADTARLLTKLAGYSISRQGVWQWWDRRARTGFPEGEMKPPVTGHRERRVFSRDEVVSWWREHEQKITPSSQKLFTQAPEGGTVDLNEGKEPGTRMGA